MALPFAHEAGRLCVPHEIRLLASSVALALAHRAVAIVGANMQNRVSVLVGNRAARALDTRG